MKEVEKTRIDRRSFVRKAIGAASAGSALLGVTACEDVQRALEQCDNDQPTFHTDRGITADTGARADPWRADRCII